VFKKDVVAMNIISNLEAMLAEGQDNSLIRFGLANAYLSLEDFDRAIEHYEQAIHQDSRYIAAWKMYARTLTFLGQIDAAKKAYQRGVSLADEKGDYQAVKEMREALKALRSA